MITERLRLLGYALRQSLNEKYTTEDFKNDLKAGTIVGLVAIPLGMALSVAIGVPPENGLYTCIVAGIIAALLGGSKFQVTGPTAAFVVILIPIVQKFGIQGLFLAGLMAGILLIIIGMAGLGKFIGILPHPVITGFTSGIALVIFTLQIKDFLGLPIIDMPNHYHERVEVIVQHLPYLNVSELAIGILTLVTMIICTKYLKKNPAPLIGLAVATLSVFVIQIFFPDFEVATIANRFHSTIGNANVDGIPPGTPSFSLPWIKNGENVLNLNTLVILFPSAITIALLGAIESLLSAVVADGMAGTKHEPNAELMAQGVANIFGPFFGGIPATGAIARTATNIRFGAKSPIAAVTHGIVIFIIIIFFAPYVSRIPMASLAALLMIVAFNMSEIGHFKNILKIGTREDKWVLVTCFALTALIDMTVGVLTGFGLATLLFMHRLANLTQGSFNFEKTISAGDRGAVRLPSTVQVYSVRGPMFFGAAQRAMSSISQISVDVRTVIFDLNQVDMMDITGLTALKSAVLRLQKQNINCIILVSSTKLQSMIQGALHFVSQPDFCSTHCMSLTLALEKFVTNPEKI